MQSIFLIHYLINTYGKILVLLRKTGGGKNLLFYIIYNINKNSLNLINTIDIICSIDEHSYVLFKITFLKNKFLFLKGGTLSYENQKNSL